MPNGSGFAVDGYGEVLDMFAEELAGEVFEGEAEGEAAGVGKYGSCVDNFVVDNSKSFKVVFEAMTEEYCVWSDMVEK